MPTPLAAVSVPALDHRAPIDTPDRQGLVPTLSFNLAASVRAWVERSHQRQVLGELAELNDHLLRDIGVSQEDALHEAAKPFWRR